MAFARTIQILIASPGDVAQLRAIVPPLFAEWNEAHGLQTILHPKMWESASVPAMGDHPQAILNRRLIDESDLLIAVFYSKLGTPTPNALSGTIEEIEKFIEAKGAGRVMLYFWAKPLEQSAFEIDVQEIERLQKFRKCMQSQGLYHEFETADQFKHDLYRHLDIKVTDFLDGKLPIQSNSNGAANEDVMPQASPDKWRFGSSIEAIGRDFLGQWDTMTARGDKYRDEGASLLATAVQAIDDCVSRREANIVESDRSFAERISLRLKRLALRKYDSEFRERPFQFWREGKQIADDFITHIDFRLNHRI